MRALALGALLALPAAGAATGEIAFQDVVVKPGDTLWGISNAYLKNPERWDEIVKHNRLPSKDPTVALPGMVLKVPVSLIKEHLRAAVLVYRLNKVLFRRKETADWRDAPASMELFRNDSLRTLDASRARVRFLNEDLLALDPNSMAIIKPIDKDFDVELKRGGLFVGRSKVVTASARITPKTKDTKYSARVNNDLSTKVEVYTGRAAVEAEGQTVDVTAGMATEVKVGFAPEVPKRIEDMPEFAARAAQYDADLLREARSRVAVAAGGVGAGAGGAPSGRPGAAGSESADIEAMSAEIGSLKVGLPISAYHVQLSRSEDFETLAFDKVYDSDEKFRMRDTRLGAGRYWFRVAAIDLLGTTGVYSRPKPFTFGGGAGAAASAPKPKDIAAMIRVIKPAEDERVSSPDYRVIGRVLATNLQASVNGGVVRLDASGNFSQAVTLKQGVNEIRIAVVDQAGNTGVIVRRVTYAP